MAEEGGPHDSSGEAQIKKGLVVSCLLDGTIGAEGYNNLLWHIPANLPDFKMRTKSESPSKITAVIMGRRTFNSLPEKYRPLKERINVVVSSAMFGSLSGMAGHVRGNVAFDWRPNEVPESGQTPTIDDCLSGRVALVVKSCDDALTVLTGNNLNVVLQKTQAEERVTRALFIGGKQIYEWALTSVDLDSIDIFRLYQCSAESASDDFIDVSQRRKVDILGALARVISDKDGDTVKIAEPVCKWNRGALYVHCQKTHQHATVEWPRKTEESSENDKSEVTYDIVEYKRHDDDHDDDDDAEHNDGSDPFPAVTLRYRSGEKGVQSLICKRANLSTNLTDASTTQPSPATPSTTASPATPSTTVTTSPPSDETDAMVYTGGNEKGKLQIRKGQLTLRTTAPKTSTTTPPQLHK